MHAPTERERETVVVGGLGRGHLLVLRQGRSEVMRAETESAFIAQGKKVFYGKE